jgi:uncharacterized protein
MSDAPIYRSAVYSSIKNWRERHGRYHLAGSKCSDCGRLYFPRRLNCKYCFSRNIVRYDACKTGTVEAIWPQVPLVRLMGYANLPQRYVAIILLDDGLSVEAEIIDLTAEEAIKGLRVEMTLRRLKRESNGAWLYGYKFRKVVMQRSAEDA